MVWGAITYWGVGKLIIIRGNMNAQYYCRILEEGLAATKEMYADQLDSFILQQDNDPKHRAACTRKWLDEAEIPVMQWPSYSPT